MGLVDELCDATHVVTRALEVARELCALPREPMLRTRAMARRDLADLYGGPNEQPDLEREFGAMGAEMWFAPGTQEMLKAKFLKKS
jgi:hypothetical protein